MNRHIRRLLKESTLVPGTRWTPPIVDQEKFAKSIVEECAAYLHGAMEVHSQQEQNLYNHGAKKIKEHFGVKE